LASAERARTLGTAGHVDHGKTALVEALTGKNTDRLSEESRRGISIALGYAPLELPDGVVSVVDVPGHERLVRTMVAGATGVDLFLLAVAADDGVMPQTREHLAVMRALGIDCGVVAVTKSDLVDPESLELAVDEAQAVAPGAAVVAVSARTGEGLDLLREEIARAVATTEPKDEGSGPAILHVDRSFSLHGIGTVVTGTLWSGAIAPGDRLEILPQEVETRVRSVQIHDQPVERAPAGSRVALNLVGVDRREIQPGDVVASPGSGLCASYRIDAELRLERDPGAARVQVHHGTRGVAARMVDLGEDLVQLRLEAPLIAAPGDRFVVRSIAPPDTVGGGVVLDPAPARHGPGPATQRLAAIRERGLAAVRREEIEQKGRAGPDGAASDIPPAEPSTRAKVALAVIDADGFQPRAAADLAAGLRIDLSEAEQLLQELVRSGQATHVARDVYYSTPRLEAARQRVLDLARERGEISLAEVRDQLDTSRKYAQALLEYLDGEGLTIRRGDVHVLRRVRGP
jgi:selenocysteine-specific elongation factor